MQTCLSKERHTLYGREASDILGCSGITTGVGNLILGGSWVVISGVISSLIWVVSIVTLLITLLITTHEPQVFNPLPETKMPKMRL